MPKILLTLQDKESLLQIRDRMKEFPNTLTDVIEIMERNAFEVVQVSSFKSFIRSVETIEKFCFEAKQRILEFKYDKGDYLADGQAVPDMNRRRKK